MFETSRTPVKLATTDQHTFCILHRCPYPTTPVDRFTTPLQMAFQWEIYYRCAMLGSVHTD
jgi:hypothetical protein